MKMFKKLPNKLAFKKQAKAIAKEFNMKPTHAHELLARKYGFKTYNSFLKEIGAIQ